MFRVTLAARKWDVMVARYGTGPGLRVARHYGGPMASVKQFQVTFDCAEPERVARFWCEVLGYVVPPPPERFGAIVKSCGSAPSVDHAAAS